MLFGNFCGSNFAISCKETQKFCDFGLEEAKIWHSKSRKRQLMAIFYVEFSLAKGTIFTIFTQKWFICCNLCLVATIATEGTGHKHNCLQWITTISVKTMLSWISLMMVDLKYEFVYQDIIF